MHDEKHARRQVIEHHQLVAQHQQDVGGFMFIGIGTMCQFRLDITNRVITEIADQTTMKLGQAFGFGNLEGVQIIPR